MSSFQIHLNAKKCSKRAVRFKVLSPAEAGSLMDQAAKIVGPQGTMIELRRTQWSLCVQAMLTEYTDPTDEPMGAKWFKASTQQMAADYDKLFTAKDDQILISMYREYHEVDQEEIDSISGKALTVAD